jgi:curved DNA-binding protein CbpA
MDSIKSKLPPSASLEFPTPADGRYSGGRGRLPKLQRPRGQLDLRAEWQAGESPLPKRSETPYPRPSPPTPQLLPEDSRQTHSQSLLQRGSPPSKDPYTILGLEKGADQMAIRDTYRKLLLKCHPDRIKDEAERARGTDDFMRVQQAYKLLSDPAQRARYDIKVALNAVTTGPPVSEAFYGRRPPPRPAPRYEQIVVYPEQAPQRHIAAAAASTTPSRPHSAYSSPGPLFYDASGAIRGRLSNALPPTSYRGPRQSHDVSATKLTAEALRKASKRRPIAQSEKESVQNALDAPLDEAIDELGAMPHYPAQVRTQGRLGELLSRYPKTDRSLASSTDSGYEGSISSNDSSRPKTQQRDARFTMHINGVQIDIPAGTGKRITIRSKGVNINVGGEGKAKEDNTKSESKPEQDLEIATPGPSTSDEIAANIYTNQAEFGFFPEFSYRTRGNDDSDSGYASRSSTGGSRHSTRPKVDRVNKAEVDIDF